MHKAPPDVAIYTAAIDRQFNNTATPCRAWALRVTVFSAPSKVYKPNRPPALIQ